MPKAITYVTDQTPGITRRGKKNFVYVSPGGRQLNGKVQLRIESLAIPPAWTDVWICPDPSGHIQATGRDARGRKQYRYHDGYRQRRERAKFRDLVPFGEALGALRARIDQDLRNAALSQERVVAAVVSLIGQTYARVGNDAYARSNKSFGVTTLRNGHVEVSGSHLRLRFVGKGGKPFDLSCCDPQIARVVRRCQDLPGQRLFQYETDEGTTCAVTSTEVNEYLRAATGIDATARTFRTWGATLLAAQNLVVVEPPDNDTALRRAVNDALRPVADALGNTLAVCRASYVHPQVLKLFADDALAESWAEGPSRARAGITADERRLLRLLTPGS